MAVGKLTEKLIDFALKTEYEDIPDTVIRVQKKSLLDSIGVMAAATTLESACAPFVDFALENSAGKICTIVGTGEKASPVLAAMVNGALIHALDYEDGHDLSKTHPNTASIPAFLALGEERHLSGREILKAMAVCAEITCRLKQSLLISDLENGWYSPPMFSAYGAVLGGAGLLKFSEVAARDALSLCMTQVMLPGQAARSGESVLRAVRDAFSAKAAVFSLLMAEKGTAARMDEPLEGKYGLFTVLAKGQYDQELILGDLGKHWICEELRYKAWPCCGTVHGALDTLLELLHQHAVRADEVEEIHLEVNPVHLRVLDPYEVKYTPGSLAAAKFSMPFSLALGVLYGDVRLEMFREENLCSRELLETAQKVTYHVRKQDPGAERDYPEDDHVKVTLKTTRGIYEKESFVSLGSPKKPLSREQREKKFFDCMKFARVRYDKNELDSLVKTVDEFERVPDIAGWIR